MMKALKSFLLFALCALLIFGAVALGVVTANVMHIANMGGNFGHVELETPVHGGISNILILGIDSFSLADTIMLVSVNGADGSIRVLSIPRDTRVQFGNRFGKINEASAIGYQNMRQGHTTEPEDLIIRKVRELTGLAVHYFVAVEMDAFVNIVNIFGGVEVDVPIRMFYRDPTPGHELLIDLQPGLQVLNGAQAEQFVRFRGFDGDLGRIQRQQQFISAFAEQKLRPQYIFRVNDLFAEIYDSVRTNFTGRDLLRYVSLLRTLDGENIQTFQVPGNAGFIGQISYFIPNLQALESLISEYFMLRLDEPQGYDEPYYQPYY